VRERNNAMCLTELLETCQLRGCSHGFQAARVS
jgi:hypothetical protein